MCKPRVKPAPRHWYAAWGHSARYSTIPPPSFPEAIGMAAGGRASSPSAHDVYRVALGRPCERGGSASRLVDSVAPRFGVAPPLFAPPSRVPVLLDAAGSACACAPSTDEAVPEGQQGSHRCARRQHRSAAPSSAHECTPAPSMHAMSMHAMSMHAMWAAAGMSTHTWPPSPSRASGQCESSSNLRRREEGLRRTRRARDGEG